MSRINAGRTFADRDNPTRWYVVLEVDSVWSLVWWEAGEPRWFPVSEVKQRKVVLDSYDFPVYQLLARWGVTSRDVDRFMEARVYAWDVDVRNVRATRRALNGRTIDHVRHRHRSDTSGGGDRME